MEEKASKHEFKDTEELLQWRSINQEGMNNVRKSFRKIEEAVVEKYKVEVSKRGAHRRGEPSEWRNVQRVKNINLESGMKTVARESFRGSGNTICSERKV